MKGIITTFHNFATEEFANIYLITLLEYLT